MRIFLLLGLLCAMSSPAASQPSQPRSEGDFVEGQLRSGLEVGYARASGIVGKSFYQSARRAGAPRSVIVQMIHLFSYAVDFQRDIQKGDKFEVLFRVYRDKNGQLLRAGEVAYASLTVGGTTHKVYRYKRNKKVPAKYLNENGKSNRKALMRTPIDGAKLVSDFGERRALAYGEGNVGVDYSAPYGTPIYASGDGTVIRAGVEGGYGKHIRIRHNKEYLTTYSHMSQLHVKRGERVKQGQVIGRVGASGRVTGPHLHYELLRNGKFINPAIVALPPRKQLKGSELKRFIAIKKKMDTIFAALSESNKAGKE